MNESPLQPNGKDEGLSERIGVSVSLSEICIRQRLRLITCLCKDQHSYRVVGKPTLPHAEIDAIIQHCKNSFGTQRAEMNALLENIIQTRKAYEIQHEAHCAEATLRQGITQVFVFLWGLVSSQPEVADRETVSQIAVYKTLETLVKIADLEVYEPERIAEISANDPESGKIRRLLAMKV
jgi:hypothetical protein